MKSAPPVLRLEADTISLLRMACTFPTWPSKLTFFGLAVFPMLRRLSLDGFGSFNIHSGTVDPD